MGGRLIKEDIDRFADYGLYPKTRTILLMENPGEDGDGQGTTCSVAKDLVRNLHLLTSTNSDPITIIMNISGGDFYHGSAIYDAIAGCRDHHITVVGTGYVMSMGSIIIQAADRRVMTPTATMMLHYGSNGKEKDQHSKDLIKTAEEEKRINLWMEDLYLEKIREAQPKFSRRRLREMINFDKYLDAKRALGLGLIDEIRK
jgi:ATP-dependent protease ClpP protease subunit